MNYNMHTINHRVFQSIDNKVKNTIYNHKEQYTYFNTILESLSDNEIDFILKKKYKSIITNVILYEHLRDHIENNLAEHIILKGHQQ